MASFNFTLPGSTKSFTIKGPDGFTEAQAKAIFDQQAAAGSFVGFKPGDVLNTASQAAAGLPGAASQLAQAQAGTTSIINGSVIKNAIGQISGQVSKVVNQTISVAKQAVSTVTNIIKKVPVTNGINTADFAKQAPALTSIGNLTPTDVKSSLAQASKLVGQTADKITNTAGVGKFGFDAPQLEAAGVLKPGVAAQYLQNGTNSLTDVLKSPTVFTGKDGIKSINDLLGSESKQNGIQQNLMAQGLSGLKQVGIPVNNLAPAVLAGTVLNAAKSLTSTTNWAKGLPLPADIKSQFDKVAKDASYAVDFANQKVSNSLKQEIVPKPASDTVNRETLNAAATRVVGSLKVPFVSYISKPKADPAKFSKEVESADAEQATLIEKTQTVLNNSNDDANLSKSVKEVEQLLGSWKALDSKYLGLTRQANLIKTELGTAPDQLASIEEARELISNLIKSLEMNLSELRQRIKDLAA